MQIVLLLYPHQNIRYRASMLKIARETLRLTLAAMGRHAEIQERHMGDAAFLCFSAENLTTREVSFLSQMAGFYMIFRSEDGESLLPISGESPAYLPRDLASLLKYKGKTNEMFTDAMISMALALSGYADRFDSPLTLCDPMAGKGTAPMLALCRGYNGIGIEVNAKDVLETAGYMERYFAYHHLKHKNEKRSLTVKGKQGAVAYQWTFADTAEHFKAGDTRFFRMICGDTRQADRFISGQRVHLMTADLPYGVQKGTAGKKDGIFETVAQAMPGWANLLADNGVLCLSFNTHVTRRKDLEMCGTAAGLVCAETEDLAHWVEQAIDRDVIFFRKGALT